MTLTHITFIKVEKVEKLSKAGTPYAFLKLEGIAHQEGGDMSVFRYDFWPTEKGAPLPLLHTGDHVPVYGCAPHWETAKLEPRFMGFKPVQRASAPKPQ